MKITGWIILGLLPALLSLGLWAFIQEPFVLYVMGGVYVLMGLFWLGTYLIEKG